MGENPRAHGELPAVILEGRHLPDRSAFRNRISYNALIRLSGRLVGAAVTVVGLHLVTTYFGPSTWGLVVAAMALANLFVGLCDFGVARIVSRDVAARPDEAPRVYGAGILAALGNSFAGVAVMAITAYFLYEHRPAVKTLALILLWSLPANALWVTGGAVLVAKARNDTRAILDLGSSILLLIGTIASIELGFGSRGYVLFTVIADLVTAVLALTLARRYLRMKLRGTLARVHRTLRAAQPVGGSVALSSVYLQGDIILLSFVAGASAVGVFGVAYQIALFVSSVPSMLMAAVLPKFLVGDHHRRRALAQRALDMLCLAGGGVALVIAVFSRSILTLISGDRFVTAAPSLAILGVYAAMSFPTAVFVDGLVFVGQQRRLVPLFGVVSAVNVVFAAVLVPLYGAMGTAMTLLVSAVVMLALASMHYSRATHSHLSWRAPLRFSSTAIACFIGVRIVGSVTSLHSGTSWLTLFELFVVAAVYASTSLLVGGRSLLRSSSR